MNTLVCHTYGLCLRSQSLVAVPVFKRLTSPATQPERISLYTKPKKKKCRHLLQSTYGNSKCIVRKSTVENQYKQIAIAVTPLYWLRYEDQLEYKNNHIHQIFCRTINQFVHTRGYPLSEGFIENLKSHNLMCQLEPCLPSPIIDGYRRKDEVVLGRGIDGNPRTVGLIVGKGNHSFCVPITYLTNISSKHKEIAKAFQEFVNISKFEPLTHHMHPTENSRYITTGHWRSLSMRSTSTNETMCYVNFHPQRKPKEIQEEAKEELLNVFLHGPGRLCGLDTMFFQPTSRSRTNAHVVPFQLLYGQPYVTEHLLDYRFRVSIDSFFQINTSAAEVLYSVIRDCAKLRPTDVLLDICCGTGSIGITLASDAKRLFGVEIIQQAIDDAKINAEMNGVVNVDYICSRASQALKKISIGTYFDPSETAVAVVNPGRIGVNQSVIRSIRRCKPIRRLVYVTCRPIGNTITNFIDLCCPPTEKLPGKPFTMTRAIPVDMFPSTVHCELVVVFER